MSLITIETQISAKTRNLEKKLSTTAAREAEQAIRDAIYLVTEKVKTVADTKYMSGPRPNVLDKVTGRLSKSIWTGVQHRYHGMSVVFGITFTAGRYGSRGRVKLPYAAVHELGSGGKVVTVPKHRRMQMLVFGTPMIPPRKVEVSEYERHMNIRPRPYLAPAINDVMLQSAFFEKLVDTAIQKGFEFDTKTKGYK